MVVLAMVSMAAKPGPILDQIQIHSEDSLVAFGSSEHPKFAQTFQPSVAGTLNKIVVYISPNGSPADNMVMKIYKDNSGVPGDLVATSDVNLHISIAQPCTFIFFLYHKVHIQADTTYWFVISRTGELSSTNNYQVWGGLYTDRDLYTRGDAYLQDSAGNWNNIDTTTLQKDAYFSEFYTK